jgi:hypothetical protein
MIKKTLTYKNFNDETVTRDFYFHLSRVDMTEISLDGSFEARIKKAAAENDKVTIFREFKRLIFLSVGVRTGENLEDFIRPEMFRETFMSSPAFDVLIEELFTSEDQGASFIAGLLPKDMQEAALKGIESAPSTVTVDPFRDEPAWLKERRAPTPAEYNAATPDQQKIAFNFAFQNQKS